MENRIGKLINQVKRRSISLVAPLNNEAYMKALNKYMIKAGFNINGDVCYVHPTVYFDGSDYSLITLENGVSISRDASGNPCVVLCKTSEWLEKKHFEC